MGKGSQDNPVRPDRDYYGLLGLIAPYWEDLAPLVEALVSHFQRSLCGMLGPYLPYLGLI